MIPLALSWIHLSAGLAYTLCPKSFLYFHSLGFTVAALRLYQRTKDTSNHNVEDKTWLIILGKV